MAQSWNSWSWQLGLASSLALFGANTFFGNCALAQSNIVPDNTLGNDSSIVLPSSNGAADEVLIGGAQEGANLFHSFQEFNVGEGLRAYFYSPSANIQNILARVTGGNPSKIMGVLGTYGNSEPNLFLINPNGIIFGPNARLDVSGSFVASTARSVLFADGNQYSANNSQTPPLLTVSVPLGLQLGDTAGDISVQGAFLGVQAGKTLALVGGNLVLEGSYLNAEGGRIELGSLAGTSQVRLNPIDKGWTLGYEGVQNFQDIQLSQEAVVNASGEGSGDIQLHGRRITLTEQSGIFANNSLSQNGGGISIQGLELSVQDGSVVSTDTTGTGQGGNLDVTASESVKLSGTSADGQFGSGLYAQTQGTGAVGNLKIATGQLQILDGAVVSTDTTGAGQGGNLDVTASESVKLSGTSANGQFGSGLYAQTQGTGAAGNLKIATGQLQILDGAVVSTDTNGTGQGGNLDVTASESIKLSGTSGDGEVFSGLFAQTEGSGAAGNLRIATRKLLIQNGAVVSSNTSGQKQGGTLDVTASESVKLSGTSADGQFGSGLYAENLGMGAAGNLKIATRQLQIIDGAVVSASSTGATGQGGTLDVTASESVKLSGTSADGQVSSGLYAENLGMGAAGNLKITTGQLQVLDGAVVSASTSSGQGGNITLQAQDIVVLRRGSNISSTAGTANTGGDGGNITIDTPFIVAVPAEDSNITANAFMGKGGFIQITAQGIFGLERSENLTRLGDITAFSQQETELNGIVEINTPNVEPSRGLVTLPVEPVDVTGLIAQGCSTGEGQAASEFIITGRGGLPPTPRETLSSDTVLEDWGTLALVPAEPLSTQRDRLSSQQNEKHRRLSVTRSEALHGQRDRQSGAVSTYPVHPTPAPLVEAQGWIIGANNEVVLTAQAPTVTHHNPWLTPGGCHGTT